MKSIAVTKPDMAVLDRDRTGLSSFGMLSALFGQEILQRSQRRLGFWRPVPLELLEDGAEQQAGGQGGVNINLDMTLLLKSLREEQKGLRKQEKREKKENARAVEKLLERIVWREERERTQQINIQASAIGRSHTIRVTQQSAPRSGLEPVSSVTASPAAGGWQPQWRQQRPGFPAAVPKASPAGSGGSILLPDALRRRRERALEEAAFSAAADRTEELLRREGPVLREQLRREVSRSVEEAVTRQTRAARRQEFRAGADAARTEDESAVPKEENGASDFYERRLIYREDEHGGSEDRMPASQQAAGERQEKERKGKTQPDGERRSEGAKQPPLPAEGQGTSPAAGGETSRGRAVDRADETEGETKASPQKQAEFHGTQAGAAERAIEFAQERGSEENRSSKTEQSEAQQGVPSGKTAVDSRREVETELLYREGAPVETVRSEQSGQVRPSAESSRHQTETQQGLPTQEHASEARLETEAGAELLYRAGDASASEHPVQTVQARPGAEDSAKQEEQQQGLPVQAMPTASRLETATELLYREGDASTSEHPVQTGQVRPGAEDSAKQTEQQQGFPVQAVPAASRLETATELLYREGDASTSEHPVQTGQVRPGAEDSAKQTEQQQGFPVQAVPAASRLETATELLYREGDASTSEHPVQTGQVRPGAEDSARQTEQQQQGLPVQAVPATTRLEAETELLYRAGNASVSEHPVQTGQVHPGTEDSAKQTEQQQGFPVQAVPATTRLEAETELLYRAGDANASEHPVQTEQVRPGAEDSVKQTEQQQQGLPVQAVPATTRLEAETELLYRAGNASVSEHPVQTGQVHPGTEDSAKQTEQQQGFPVQAVPATTRLEAETELLYRAGDANASEHPVQTEQVRPGAEDSAKQTEQQQQGLPVQAVPATTRLETETELLYRAGDASTSEHPLQTGQVRPGAENSAKQTEQQQGLPVQAVPAATRLETETELLYRAGETSEAVHLAQTGQAHSDRQGRGERQTHPQDSPVRGAQPPVTPGRDIRILPGSRPGLVYREGQGQLPAEGRPSARDIRILRSVTPARPPEAVSSQRAEERPLSYLQPPEGPGPAKRKPPADSALPQWAQKLLEKPAGPDVRPAGGVSYTAPQQAPVRQMQWTAPAAVPQTPNITYHAKPPAAPAPPVQPAALSDRELRRAADKIYRMIEERLRREMRRSGR